MYNEFLIGEVIVKRSKPNTLRRSKSEAYIRYHQFYKLLPDCDPYRCFYCGLPADSKDHAPALENVLKIGMDELKAIGVRFYLIPSCRECNSMLGNKPYHDPYTRMNYVKKCLEKRYSKFLRNEIWTSDELLELGYSLNTYIRNFADMQLVVERRLAYPLPYWDGGKLARKP